MKPSPTLHILIGLPGSGKSTVAKYLTDVLSNSIIISTDAIRERLYGDPIFQGVWEEIETEILKEFDQAIAQQAQHIVYDATNAKRDWRLQIIHEFKQHCPKVNCLGWWLQTSLDDCLARNQARSRQVPETVIQAMHQELSQFPPNLKRDKLKVVVLPNSDLAVVQEALNQIQKRSKQNQQNRASHHLHQYACDRDFKRLISLIQLMLEHPGIGNLQQTSPETFQQANEFATVLDSGLDEVIFLLQQKNPDVNLNSEKVVEDLTFLDLNGILGHTEVDFYSPIQAKPFAGGDFIPHRCSNLDVFQRVMTELRYLLHEPLINLSRLESLEKLLETLRLAGIQCNEHVLRDDFRKTFHEFNLFPQKRMASGYYLGTAVFTPHELKRIYDIQKAYWHLAQSPEEQAIFKKFEEFEERLLHTKSLDASYFETEYPLRVILNKEIYNWEEVSHDCVLRDRKYGLQFLEAAIQQGMSFTLSSLKYDTQNQDSLMSRTFDAWGLQLVFNNVGWYLGYERLSDGLYAFERLDRLKITPSFSQKYRKPREHQNSLNKLVKLYKANGIGIFLGRSVEDQRSYLGKNPESVEIRLQLWCSDSVYLRIRSGIRRFPPQKLQYKPRFGENSDRFPHEFLITLPKWVIDDFDLRRWILGYGADLMVKAPQDFQEIIKGYAVGISQLYSVDSE